MTILISLRHSGDCVGYGNGSCGASGIRQSEGAGLRVGQGLATEVAEGKLHGARSGEMDGCDAGELSHWLAVGFECDAGGGQGSGESEAGEGAMHIAARVDALDDLLAEVAAFGEVEGARLAGLLRQVVGFFGVANIRAVTGRAFENMEVFEGLGRGGGRSRCDEGCGEMVDRRWIGPEFEAGNEGAVGVEKVERRRFPRYGLQSQG